MVDPIIWLAIAFIAVAGAWLLVLCWKDHNVSRVGSYL